MTMHVVFVAPYYGPTAHAVIERLLAMEDTRVGMITVLPANQLPAGLDLAGHYQVDDALDAGQLRVATRAFQKEWGRVDRLIGYLEHLQLPLATVREDLGIEGIHRATASCFRDKNRMKAVLGEAGLPVARQRLITGPADAFAFVEEVGFPIVLKPTHGVGSQDTHRIGDSDTLHAVLNRLLPSRERPVQGEEFVTGNEHTLEAVCIDGEVVWRSSTYYLPGPLRVIENPWMQYCVLLPREEGEPHVESFAPVHGRAMQALGLKTGFSHMEWFVRDDGTHVIGEVGARPAGVNIMHLNAYAHDVDFWEKWVRLEVHRTWSMPARSYAAGSAFLRGHGSGRAVVEVSGVDDVLASLGDRIVAHHLPKVGQPRSSHYEGEGWVIVRDPSTQATVEALRRVIEGIQVRYG